MDKKTQFIVGGVAVIGIIAYLYNQKKNNDALKSTLEALSPASSVTNDLVVPNFGDITPVGVDNLIINPDGSVVDTSVISLMTSPSVSNVTSSPSKDTTSSTTSATTSSTPARFDGGFANAIGSTSGNKECKYVYEIVGYDSSGTAISRKKLVCTTPTAKFDGGFDYADGCSVDPVLGL